MSCDVCRKAGPDIAGNTEFVIGKKKYKRESLVYRNNSFGNNKRQFYYKSNFIFFLTVFQKTELEDGLLELKMY
jgi:hypothetical protein